MSVPFERIVSGGQTGVDRAALDVAIELGLEHGGWCPLGRRAEDGVIPNHYQLRETESRHYWVRTERNVVESDATLILYREPLRGGTKFTLAMTRKHKRPCRRVELVQVAACGDMDDWRLWLREGSIRSLNVAGPRESSAPGIYRAARRWLTEWLHRLRWPLG